MKELIERIARALVDKPEEVTVTALEGSQSTVLELKVCQRRSGQNYRKAGTHSQIAEDNFRGRLRQGKKACRTGNRRVMP